MAAWLHTELLAPFVCYVVPCGPGVYYGDRNEKHPFDVKQCTLINDSVRGLLRTQTEFIVPFPYFLARSSQGIQGYKKTLGNCRSKTMTQFEPRGSFAGPD